MLARDHRPALTHSAVRAAAPAGISFPKTEEATLKFWDEVDAFKNQLRQSEGKPEYSFYDGPPFATGSPHYGTRAAAPRAPPSERSAAKLRHNCSSAAPAG